MAVDYLIVFMVSLAVSVLLTPLFMQLAKKVGAVDKPGPRRVNVKPITRMGGPAMFIAFTAGIIIARNSIPEWYAVLAGSFIALAVGLWDDVRSVPPVPKLLCHIAAGCVAYGLGVRIEFVTNPFGGGIYELREWVSFGVTVFWLVGITNAMNLIDGLDGLAAGIVSIATLTFFLVAVSKEQVAGALMSLAIAGAAGGFLRWNFYPAKTIMGDSGAYFLGFTAAALDIVPPKGIARWVCTSIAPGSTSIPAASETFAPGADKSFPIAEIFPSFTPTSATKLSEAVTMVPFLIIKSMVSLLRAFSRFMPSYTIMTICRSSGRKMFF